ncbi:CvfB family protein [Pedobacter montanisoli]|uniref:S1-like domain-containing RNA-binding protein n=1 Tax=Pedobacter montanisoli TaxID=2923277 RepID=A0ABS9ZZX2_9SPHI|nr:S1-like domain-containing RNA-binding protein [Pedobacter montanisoli]MCJ0743856.1 S1-like domain-containing RNA-binding protein [Pedobacter montanisoli]
MIRTGEYNNLRVAAKNSQGLSLSDGSEEVLLPFTEVPKNIELGDNIEVFVYKNKDNQTIATTKKALATANEFALLTVVDVTDDGAYLDLGIDKDVFVPNREQKRPMQRDESYVVYVYVDEISNRLLASSKVDKFVEHVDHDFEEGDMVDLLIVDKSDLGYNAIINNEFIGLLYNNELFTHLEPGMHCKGWIKKIRVEGKIDLTLQPSGFGHILDTKDVILNELKETGGKINLGDKSSPEEIYHRFKVSKSAFKKAIGGLYKERLITVSDHEIALVK